jgi:hypothetical protein
MAVLESLKDRGLGYGAHHAAFFAVWGFRADHGNLVDLGCKKKGDSSPVLRPEGGATTRRDLFIKLADFAGHVSGGGYPAPL